MSDRKSQHIKVPAETRELIEVIATEKRWKLGVTVDECVKDYAQRHGFKASQPRRKQSA